MKLSLCKTHIIGVTSFSIANHLRVIQHIWASITMFQIPEIVCSYFHFLSSHFYGGIFLWHLFSEKNRKQEGQHIGATYKSILKVLLKQYRSPTDPNKFKSATIISVDHFQITMRHDLDRWPFDPKINRAHPWLMVSKCMKFHDHRLITESVIVRKPFSSNHAPWPWPLTFWPQNQ